MPQGDMGESSASVNPWSVVSKSMHQQITSHSLKPQHLPIRLSHCLLIPFATTPLAPSAKS